MTKPNIVCSAGLIPYLVYFFYTRSFISCVVFCNGILYHFIAPNVQFVRLYDMISNIILITYVNIKALDMYVFLTTVIGTLCYVCNKYYVRRRAIHVICVQWIGLLTIQMAEKVSLLKHTKDIYNEVLVFSGNL